MAKIVGFMFNRTIGTIISAFKHIQALADMIARKIHPCITQTAIIYQ